MGEGVQSIFRALNVLRLVAHDGARGLRLADIARGLDMHKASAARIASTLVSCGALERRTDRRYRTSSSFHEAIGIPVSVARLRAAASMPLARLVDDLGDAAFLSVRSAFDSLCIERQVGSHPIQALSLDVGSRRPLGVGAGSLSLIAWQNAIDLAEAIERNREKIRAYPRMGEREIRRLAIEARAQGFTAVQDMVVQGMTGLGMPIRDAHGLVIAAVSVAGITDRLTGQRRQEAVALLLKCRTEIEANLFERTELAHPTDSSRTTSGGKAHEGV
jgi:DNA-binding IclR family transcriptional regulator